MPLITGTTYKIINTDQNVLESGAGHAASLGPWNDGATQKWEAIIQPGTQNSWYLKNVGTGRFLGVEGNVPANPVLDGETDADLVARFDNARIVGLNDQNAWFIPALPAAGELAYKIHYKDPNQPADHRFDVEGGGLVTVTDVSNPARDYHRAGEIIRLFFDSNTVTQVWKFEVV